MGPTMVLASASPKGSARAGGNTYATLLPADNLPAGYTSDWTVTISPNDDEGFYICNPEGFGLNYRADWEATSLTGQGVKMVAQPSFRQKLKRLLRVLAV